jgi:hypothetical protein
MKGLTFVGLLGGNGFNPDFQRVVFAFRLANEGRILVTSGLGLKDGITERDFLADLFWERFGKIVLNGQGGDPIHRDSRDDIRQVFNAISGYCEGECLNGATIIFPTEGMLHALRIWVYAKMQLPPGVSAKIICVDDGVKITAERRVWEIVGVAKMLLWVFKRSIKKIF